MWVNTQLDAYSLKHLIHLTPSISEEVKSLNTEVYFSGQIKNWMKILNLASMGIKRNEFSWNGYLILTPQWRFNKIMSNSRCVYSE